MNRNLKVYTSGKLDGGKGIDSFFRKHSVTTWFIIVNVVAFIILRLFLLPSFGEEKFVNEILPLFSLQANLFFSGKFWTLLTSMFIHIASWHLFANMISLFFIGNLAEKIIGRKRFFWLYMVSGIFAGLFFVFLAYFFGITEWGAKIFGSPEVFAVGASGAIFALLGLLAIMTPHTKIYLIMGPIIALILQAIFTLIFPNSGLIPSLNLMVSIYVILAILSIFSFNSSLRKLAVPVGMPIWFLPFIAIIPLVIIGLFIPLPFGNTAHLGGLLVGLGYGFYLKKKYRRKTQMIAKYFSS